MKIIYLMFCDWNWIKQRPHYIAEELSKENGVIVFYPNVWWDRNSLPKNEFSHNILYNRMFCIPGFRTKKILKLLFSIINRIKLRILIYKSKSDCIWVSHPDQVTLIKGLKNIDIVYDCMDNYKELERLNARKEQILKDEQELVQNAKLCITSSNWLKSMLQKRYMVDESKIVLVRNAYNGNVINLQNQTMSPTNEIFRICYVGTISDWFNWEIILESLRHFNNIEYHLLGPISTSESLPVDKRIIYHGVVKHDNLFEYVKDYDLFIMPFKINSLIEAVDPVKMYEYINFGKNIISVYYDEINRFSPYVYFYNNYSEYETILNDLIECNSLKYTSVQRSSLLKNNKWEERARCIVIALNSLK